MAMDFPSSPTEGQTYQAPGGPLYTYRAPAWRSGIVGIPAAPSDGAAYVMRNGLWEKTGWKAIYRLTPTAAGTTTVVFPLGGAKAFRIGGDYRPSAASSYLYARLSYDGGVTYKSGGSDYADAVFRQQNTTLSGAAGAASSAMFMSGNADSMNVNSIPFTVICANGDATRLFKYISTNLGWWAGGPGGSTYDVHQGHSATMGTATHMNLYCGAGSFDVGTDIVVEAPS